MALKNCKECGNVVSTEAKACPHCGGKPPRHTKVSTVAIGIIMLIIIGSCISKQNESREAQAVKPAPTPEEVAETAKKDRQMTEAVDVLRRLKKSMKNPDSFVLDSFTMYPDGSTCYEYRASNSFNALIPGKALLNEKARTVITMDNDKNKFVKQWNEICTKSGGRDLTNGVKSYDAAWR